MMAVALLLLEIAVGDLPVPHEAAEGVAVPPVPNPLVEEHHVVRAWDVLSVFHQIRSIMTNGVPEAREAAQDRLAARDAAARRAAGSARMPAARAEWQDFDMTQGGPAAPLAQVEAAAEGGDMAASPPETREAAPAGPASSGGTAAGASQDFLLVGDPVVPSIDVGYGEAGMTVQSEDIAEVVFKDREVMKKTILRGEAVIYGTDVCDSIRKNIKGSEAGARARTVSVKIGHWKAVMKVSIVQSIPIPSGPSPSPPRPLPPGGDRPCEPRRKPRISPSRRGDRPTGPRPSQWG